MPCPARSLSLRTWFFVVVLTATLPVAGIMAWGAFSAREQRIQNAYSVLLNVARVSALAQQRQIESARLLLVGLANSWEVRRQNFAQCARYFAEVRPSVTHLANLGFADLQGRMLCSALPMPQAVNVSDREYFIGALERSGFSVGRYQIGRVTHVGSVVFAVPVKDVSGSNVGVAFAAFELSAFAPFPDAARLPAHPQFFTLDRDGVVLAAAPAAHGLVGREIPGAPLRQALRAGGAGIVDTLDADGRPTLYAFAPVRSAREAALFVVLGVPKALLVGPVDRALATGLGMLAAGALAFCALAWLGFRRWVVRPVEQLVSAADAVAAGELSARASGAGPVAEYRRMQERFNRMAETLEARERLLSGLVEVSADSYWEMDAELRFKSFSDNMQGSGHFPAEQFLGKLRWETPSFGVTEEQWAEHRATLEARRPFRDFIVGRIDHLGQRRYISISGRPTYDRDGAFTGYQGVATDVTERMRYEQQIQHLATHDALTGLPNRSLLADRATQVLSSARRQGRSAAVLLFDLDNFKLHNDSFGHQGGDALLQQVSGRIAQVLRDGDTLARLGGDEFVALLSDLRHPDDVAAVVAKLRGALGQPFRIQGQDVFVTASIGVSIYPDDGPDLETLVRHADAAMYTAKDLGRDDVRYFTPELNRRAAERLVIEADLRRALERGEFAIHYQPLVDLYTREIAGAEALLRWNHPAKGLVPPGQFIQIAEDSGLIVAIGHWILDEGCRQLRAWQDRGVRLPRLSFNLSPRQFRDEALVSRIAGSIAGAGLGPERIELELTENLVMGSADRFEAGLRQLKQLGVGLAIDDFGTGYSSLNYLKRFPIDTLKIDQSFVRGLEHDPDDAAIARTVIALARSLKLRVVAEGVETFGQLEFLRLHGCHEIQGYYVAQPMPAAEFERFVRDGLARTFWSAGGAA
jgi:diguanylate cyclase (GGDEF)-like protein/PAS domain S-box-containing protein